MRDIYTTAAERITLFEPANLTVAGAQYERAPHDPEHGGVRILR